MKIELLALKLENFRGIRKYELNPDGKDIDVYSQNGSGKTTLFDAFQWLFFGKNSEGKSEFDLRPHDENNVTIKGLVLAVEARLSISGEIRIFRREHHEKVVKKQITGYETICTIDEVPKKIGDYNADIAKILPEHIFKMLTDTQYFNDKLHWTKRRSILLDLAGEIGTPEGFSRLLDELHGRSIEDYKKVLSDRKKAYSKERDGINPRMDEINRGFGELGSMDTESASEQRDKVKEEIEGLEAGKVKLLEGEEARQKQVDAVNELKVQLATLEGKLKQGDPAKVKPLLNEKVGWEKKLADKRSEKESTQSNAKSARDQLEDEQGKLKRHRDKLGIISDEYRELKKADLKDVCSACGRKLEADQIEKLEENRHKALRNLSVTGNKLKDECKAIEEANTNLQLVLDTLKKDAKLANETLTETIETKEKACAELDKQIEDCKNGVNPTADDEWKRLDKQIKAEEEKIGDSVAVAMQAANEKNAALFEELEKLNAVLNNVDQIKKDEARLTELAAREKELAQLIADVEKELTDIDNYKIEESNLIEAAVNGLFKHTTFKLFDKQLNDGIKETCEAVYGGTPYNGMSTGERIFVGLDIINVLSRHYDASVVLFLDHLESLTLPIETDAQIIGLFAEKGTEKLTIK